MQILPAAFLLSEAPVNSSAPRPQGNPALYIGLMSGTSVDGVDGVLVRLDADQAPQVLASASLPMPENLRRELLALNLAGDDELARAALAANALARLYAQAVAALLRDAGVSASAVTAIGAHGQTVRHRPDSGYTVQLNAPALLAELTGIDVVADFRSRDVAAGGQGAPLVPPFHAAIFGAAHGRAVLNLGGIANVTLLAPGQPARGFDTGPANVFLDAWCQRHLGQPYDAGGRWAATGQVVAPLLEQLIASEPWFALPPPSQPAATCSTCNGWTTAWRRSTAPNPPLRTCRRRCNALPPGPSPTPSTRRLRARKRYSCAVAAPTTPG